MVFSIRSQIALYTNVFLSCISFSIAMPSLWPYLKSLNSSKSFLALVVAFYSVGEAVGAVYFGAQALKLSTRRAMIWSTCFGISGSFLYCVAEVFPNAFGQGLVLVGRFAQGVWTGGAQGLETSFIAAVLPKHSLTPVIVNLNAVASLGFVMGPAFGFFFAVMPDFPVLAGWHFNELTGPGYLILAAGVAIVFLFVCVFDEEGDRAAATGEAEGLLAGRGIRDEEAQNGGEAQGFVMTGGMIVCNLIFFVHFFGFALQETITTPLVEAYYGWTVLQANLLFTAAGICALVSFVVVHLASRRYSDRDMTAFSLIIGILGYLLLVSTDERGLSKSRFLYGFALISVAFPVGRATTVSLYTKLLPLKDQGIGQGCILAVGAVARIVGPFWAVRAFLVKDGGLVVFGGTAVLFMACMGVMGGFYGRLKV